MDIQIITDILKEAFRGPFTHSVLILTDSGIPLRLYPSREFRVYTPFLSIADDFGARHSYAAGFMSHGFTKVPVKDPQPNQKIYLWVDHLHQAIFTTHKVARVYKSPIFNLIPDLRMYLDHIKDQLIGRGNKITPGTLEILPNAPADNPYNWFLRNLVDLAIHNSVDGWTLHGSIFAELRSVAKKSGHEVDVDALYHAALISDTRGGEIVISDALAIMYMNAIHRVKPMATKFNEYGLLVMAD